MEAHAVVEALRLAGFVQVGELRLPGDDGLHYHVFHLIHEFACVAALFLEDLEDGAEGAFVALVPIAIVLGLLVVLGEFVDRVVCQMHVDVVHIAACGFLVRFGAKTGKRHLV